jgi:hypothetical protein
LLAKVKLKLAKRKGELAKAKPKLAKRKGELTHFGEIMFGSSPLEPGIRHDPPLIEIV